MRLKTLGLSVQELDSRASATAVSAADVTERLQEQVSLEQADHDPVIGQRPADAERRRKKPDSL